MTGPGRRRAALAVAATTAITLVACGAEDPSADGGSAASGADVRRGQALYGEHCARCHGVDLMGTDQGPPHLDVVYEPSHHGDASFLVAVQRGVSQHHWDFGPMPPIPGLSEADVADIVAFVRERQRAVGIG